jgi:hypothetical protein
VNQKALDRISRANAKRFAAPKTTEAQIQEACCRILELDGWRRVRTDLKQLRGLGVQEKGMADDLFIRYIALPDWVHEPSLDFVALGQIMWIEWKKLTSRGRSTKAAQHQQDWHTLERKRGALTLIAGENFPASIEGFRDFYKKSGLMGNRIL